jgi:hypothetical protein
MLTSAYVSYYCVGEAYCLNRQAVVFSFHSISYLYFVDIRNKKETENKRVYKYMEGKRYRGAEHTYKRLSFSLFCFFNASKYSLAYANKEKGR